MCDQEEVQGAQDCRPQRYLLCDAEPADGGAGIIAGCGIIEFDLYGPEKNVVGLAAATWFSARVTNAVHQRLAEPVAVHRLALLILGVQPALQPLVVANRDLVRHAPVYTRQGERESDV